jgi:hypothetical protein
MLNLLQKTVKRNELISTPLDVLIESGIAIESGSKDLY